jgi:hypothetical protein
MSRCRENFCASLHVTLHNHFVPVNYGGYVIFRTNQPVLVIVLVALVVEIRRFSSAVATS